MEEKLVNLEANFVYTADGRLDKWRIMTAQNGKYHGDCEDYALTALYLIAGESLLRFWWLLILRKAKIIYCTIGTIPHAVLRYEKRYLDNIQGKFVSLRDLEDEDYRFSRYSYLPIQVAVKMLAYKLLLIYRKFRSG
jgi:hypothetical protein